MLKFRIIGTWVAVVIAIAYLGSLYLRQELKKGKELACKFATMIKDEGFTG